ncbi:heterokaryon incompatibility protein-domain-containing protein [Podospora didyma]|uniref:Heterokaryon incompatibility protein-domain-containing protein n=1 Tax=Podospora didyma TaxID=330526 RepID=A0AAE0NPN0_9PEZI|nr:heterokaryon incompatibility protein-domain-containing protein [Podospora didyma]
MRLLKTDTLELVEFVGRVPPYVILSHTWGSDEVSFLDLKTVSKAGLKKKAGYAKIVGCCARAIEDGYEYAWVDTCCIDKSSSAELSEAINSMYRWYHEAEICYAYMSDVSLEVQPPSAPASVSSGYGGKKEANEHGSPRPPPFRTIPSLLRDYETLPRTFQNSRWFARGWTLQELIAPPLVEFYAHDWREIGTKFSLRKDINRITGIGINVLEGADPSTCHVAERMSWAANRQTTRIEDAAYCLLGIFKVHMPLIYGEGQRAFFRLQEEIMKTTEDYTMLAWGLSKCLSSNLHTWNMKGMMQHINPVDQRRPFADSPDDFQLQSRATWTYSRLIPDLSQAKAAQEGPEDDTPPLMTSRGLRLSLLLRHPKTQSSDIQAYINCRTSRPGASQDATLSPVCLILRRQEGSNIYTGSDNPNNAFVLLDNDRELAHFTRKTVYLSTATKDTVLSQIHNHRMNSLDKTLYMLDRPKPPRMSSTSSTDSSIPPPKFSWKITSCFSHAVGAGRGHAHYEVPRKFTPATLFQPFDLPPSTARIFAFEPSHVASEAFAIVVGQGWCDIVPIHDPEFKAAWGGENGVLLVRDGYWNEGLALKFICYVAQKPCQFSYNSEEKGEAVDRVERRFGNFSVLVSLKKARRGDINCESAIKILWVVTMD